jgi:murein DD-endopeptidase MepM/ murein hydrolase activator NlpD
MRKTTAFFLILIIAGGTVMTLAGYMYITSIFNNGGRYDDSQLNDMGVLFTNQSEINAYNMGFSTTADCPWGFAEDGIDFFFNNGSEVIAAAPGLVTAIQLLNFSAPNEYHVMVDIEFNQSITLGYGIEMWTADPAQQTRQVSLLSVHVGDWVAKGTPIGSILAFNSSAHLHFYVWQNGDNSVCPQPFYGAADLAQMLTLVHTYHPDWNLCYC